MALAFAACDGAASLLGWALGADALRSSAAWCEWLGPAAVAGYGAYVLWLAGRGRRLADGGRGAGLAPAVPLALSLDNLVAGTGAASPAAAVATALGLAAASGAMALAGLWLGAALAGRARVRAEWLGGAALTAVAAALAVKELLV